MKINEDNMNKDVESIIEKVRDKGKKCKCYFIDDAGQGFTVPCCSMGEKVEDVISICSKKEYKTFVGCGGKWWKCDMVEECLKEKRMGKYGKDE